MFYVYRQNNSGGSFRPPAVDVIVEAPSAAEADTIAEGVGIYFDGAGDCPCCGNRWSEADEEWDRYETLAEAKASIGKHNEVWAKEDRIPAVIVLDKDNA